MHRLPLLVFKVAQLSGSIIANVNDARFENTVRKLKTHSSWNDLIQYAGIFRQLINTSWDYLK